MPPPGDDDFALDSARPRVDMRRNESVLLELVRLAYTAALNADGWIAFLERYREVMDAASVAFVFRERQRGGSRATVATGPAAAETMRQYNAYYGARNPLLGHGQRIEPGTVTLSQVLYPPQGFLRTEYHNDFARPFELTCGIGVWLLENHDASASIACNRSLEAGWYGQEDVEFLERLMPHLQRALQIHLRIGGLRIDQCAEADALDRTSSAVLVVTEDGRVLLANAAAQRVLAARDGLSTTHDGLRGANPADTKALRGLIGAASRSTLGERIHPGGLLRLSRPSMRQPLSVLVAPTAPALASPALPKGAVTVFVRDPEQTIDVRALVRQLYGLTNKEAELAGALLQGQSLEASCELLAVSRETARTHLRGILRKTGTRRQSDFVRRAMTSLAGQMSTVPGDLPRLEDVRRSVAV